MLLDQDSERKRIVVSGNNQLFKGAVFALVSLVWFCLLFVYIDMEWENFSPIRPFSGEREKSDFVFYFVCFSFFICTLIYSTVFYRNNLQPNDLLLRFGIILIVFTVLYVIYLLLQLVFFPFAAGAINYLTGMPKTVNFMGILYLVLSFLVLYLLFFPLILFFSQVFFNGYFGLAGYFLCFIITAIFYVAIFFLFSIAEKLDHTPYPMDDLAMILFFTLLSFGIGVSSGEEEKRKRAFIRLQSPTDRLKGSR